MKRVRAINTLLKRPQGSSIYRLFAREYLKGWVLITLHDSGWNIFSFRNFSPMTNAPINLSTELPIFTLKIPFSRCFTSENLVIGRNAFTGKIGVPLKVWEYREPRESSSFSSRNFTRSWNVYIYGRTYEREPDTPNRLLYWYSGTAITRAFTRFKWTGQQLIAGLVLPALSC